MSRLKRFTESTNPFMTEKAYEKARQEVTLSEGAMPRTMTVQGAINKSFILFGILFIAAAAGFAYPNPLFLIGGAIGGFIVVILTMFKVHLAPVTAPIYAALEGLFIGSASAVFASAYDGIIFQAVTLTMALLFMMLFIYKAGIIKVTDKFRTGVIMAIGAVFIVYMLNIVLGLFGISMPFLHDGGMISIGISLVIIGIACLSLLLDFDNFERGARAGAPEFMEWFSAMGLMITLVWLYLEILRLLAMLSRD
jgi:uncharacterized YccA/Bax inhibitor family protein